MKPDSDIRSDVESELRRDPGIGDSLIGVIARAGVVTLTGETGRYGAKWAAEEAAKRVHGVRAVANEIQIKLLEGGMRNDTDIAEAAANALDKSLAAAANRIQCVVQDGIVTLAGEVSSGEQKNAAEDSVRRLTGVKGVLNGIITTAAVKTTG
jgi:osmotically-inducible protein OsmY